MSALLPSTFTPLPSNPHKCFPSSNRKAHDRLNSSFSCNLSHGKQNHPSGSSVQSYSNPTCDPTLLLKEWPQLLKISIRSGDLFLGQAIHGFVLKMGFLNDAFGGNNLVNMYAKLCRMDYAQQMFDEMLDRNTITWTTVINGYLQIPDVESVFRVACDMHRLEGEFNEHTCSVILRACELREDRIRGEQIHGFVIKSGFCENVVVVSSLISMYSRSGCIVGAEELFNGLTSKDVQCFNSMILEYGKVGFGEKAIRVFIDLLYFGWDPSIYTFTNILSVCSGNIGLLEEGKQLNGLAVKHGLVDKTSVGNVAIAM